MTVIMTVICWMVIGWMVTDWMVTDWMVTTVLMIVIIMVIDWMVIRFCDAFVYRRRIIHQRNNFNNYHRMIGGMEDEYWEQRRREWEAWRAEEK